jgi:valyl-tRNA synthetase
MVKPRLWDENDSTRNAALYTLKMVLANCLKLLHPYMPFVTEEIFCTLTGEESIMISDWPAYRDVWNFAEEEKDIDVIKEAVRGVRNIRTEMNVPPSRKANAFVVSDKADIRKIFEECASIFAKLAYSDSVAVQADKTGISDDAVSVVIHDAVVYIPFAELVDIDKELERLGKEKTRLEGEIKRCEGMLSNERFISKAPVAKVEEEKAKLTKYKETYDQVVERINSLAK